MPFFFPRLCGLVFCSLSPVFWVSSSFKALSIRWTKSGRVCNENSKVAFSLKDLKIHARADFWTTGMYPPFLSLCLRTSRHTSSISVLACIVLSTKLSKNLTKSPGNMSIFIKGDRNGKNTAACQGKKVSHNCQATPTKRFWHFNMSISYLLSWTRLWN